MKTRVYGFLALGFFFFNITFPSAAQLATPSANYAVVGRDFNSRIWERVVYEPAPDGTLVPRKHHYTELASGLCYQQNGQWLDSKEEIDLLPTGGAAATQGQHQ